MSSSEDKFLLTADKFLESDASVVQLATSFSEFLDEAKQGSGVLANVEEPVVIEILLNCILKYLHCIIEYAGSGSALARSSTVRQLCSKICPAVEDLKIKHEFIKNLSLPTFEILFGQPSWIAKEVLRMYNDIIQNSDKAVRLEVVQEKGPYYLGRLMDAIAFGDFEFQVMIVETLYRLGMEILIDTPKVYFLTEEQTKAFHKIDTDEFDFTVRNFLNFLNDTEKHVVSLLCNKITFDDMELEEPPELAPFSGMWVDFNVTAGTITFYLNNEHFNKDIKWEMITVFPETILKTETSFPFNKNTRKKEGIAKLILKNPCQLCYASTQHKLLKCRLLTFHSLDTERFKEVFNQVFPKIHKKARQPITIPAKKTYKPLDIISVKSSTTNPSTCFNATIDSSFVDKKHKSKRGKSVTFADSTIHSDSRSLSSRKSISLSINPSIDEERDDISLMDNKIKKLTKSKRSAELDEISFNSKLSVLDLIETGRKVGNIGTSKKIRLSGLEDIDNLSVHEQGTSKNLPYSKYNEKFLSSLMEMDNNVSVLGTYNRYESMTLGGTKIKKLLQKEADSTTPVSGLYNSKMSLKDDSISSDVFHSIEDIDNDNNMSFAEFNKNWNKKKRKQQDNAISQIIASSPEKDSSILSADDQIEKRKKPVEKNTYSKSSGTKHYVIKENTGICAQAMQASSLGIKLSPDLFTCESADLVNDQNMQVNKVDESSKGAHSKPRKNILKTSLYKMEEPPWIDPVRDCQLDDFDKLKLQRPELLHLDSPKDKNLTEPDLIQIAQSKYQSPIFTETEVFETAKMDLDHEVPETQFSERNFSLFQDISQGNQNVQCSSQEDYPDFNLDEEYRSKIKVLSDIQILSPNLKSQLSEDASQKSQKKNSVFLQKENKKPDEEIRSFVQVSSQNTDTKLVMKKSRLIQSMKTYSLDENISDTAKTPTLYKSESIRKTNTDIVKDKIISTDKKQPDQAAVITDSETQMTVPSKKIAPIEDDLQFSETQRTESQITPSDGTSDPRAPLQDVEYSETQKSEAQISPPKDKKNHKVEAAKVTERETHMTVTSEERVAHEKTIDPKATSQKLKETQENASQITPPKDEKNNVKAAEVTDFETRETVSPKKTVIIDKTSDPKATSQDMEYSETQKSESKISPKYKFEATKVTELEIHRTFSSEERVKNYKTIHPKATSEEQESDTVPKGKRHKHKAAEVTDSKTQITSLSEKRISSAGVTDSETEMAVSPEKRVIIDKTTKATSEDIHHSETQKSESQISPPRDEKHKVKVADVAELEKHITVTSRERVENEKTLELKSKDKKFSETQTNETHVTPPKDKKRKHKAADLTDSEIQITTSSEKRRPSQDPNFSESQKTVSQSIPRKEKENKLKTAKVADLEAHMTVKSEERVKHDKTFDPKATSQDLKSSETQENKYGSTAPKDKKHKLNSAKVTECLSQMSVSREKKVITDKTSDTKVTYQDMKYSEKQKSESQIRVKKYKIEAVTSEESIANKKAIKSKATSQDLKYSGKQESETHVTLPKDKIREHKTGKVTKSEPQITASSEKRIRISETKEPKPRVSSEETINHRTKPQELQYPKKQKNVSPTSPHQYEIKSTQKSNREGLTDPKECISNCNVQSASSQKVSFSEIYGSEKQEHRTPGFNSNIGQKRKKKLQIKDFILKKPKRRDSCSKGTKRKTVDNNKEDKVEGNKSSCELVHTKVVSKPNRKRRQIINLPSQHKKIKKDLPRASEVEEDDAPSFELKPRSKNEIGDENSEGKEERQVSPNKSSPKLPKLHSKIEKNTEQKHDEKSTLEHSNVEKNYDSNIGNMIKIGKKVNSSNIAEREKTDIPLSELKQLPRDERTDENRKIQNKCDTTSKLKKLPQSNNRLSKDEGSQEKSKMMIETCNENHTDFKIKENQSNNSTQKHKNVNKKEKHLIIRVEKMPEIYNSIKNLSAIIEKDEEDMSLSKLKKHLKNKIQDTSSKVDVEVPQRSDEEIFQIDGNEKVKDCPSQHKDDKDQNNIQSQLPFEKQKNSQKEEKIHSAIGREEYSDNNFDRVGIPSLNSELGSNTPSAVKKLKCVGQKSTFQKPTFEDNEPYSVENIGSKELNNKKQANYNSSQESDKSTEDQQSLLNTKIDLFRESSESTLHKVVEHSGEKDNNIKKRTEVDELEKSLHLIFGTEEDLIEKDNSEIKTKNDNSLNITFDTTNSIIAGNVGILKRGRKLFDPENKVENFLTCSIIDEEIGNSLRENDQIEIQTMSDYHQKKKQTPMKTDIESHIESKKTDKRKSLKLDEEVHIELNKTEKRRSLKIDEDLHSQLNKTDKRKSLESDERINIKSKETEIKKSIKLNKEVRTETKKKNKSNVASEKKNKSNRYSDIQKKQCKVSELDYIKYSRKKRLDSFYDKVVEKLKSANSSTRKSYSASSKVKKTLNDSTGKYDLDFSMFKETLLGKKERCAIRLKHSTNDGILEIREGDGNGSKDRNVIMESQQDDTDETMKVILRGLGTLCQKIAEGTMKTPSPSIQKNLFAAAALLLEL